MSRNIALMFRFTIRELVLLTVIVAMGMAWWLDRSRQIVRYDRLKYAVELGGPIGFDSSGELHPAWYPPRQMASPDEN